MDELAGRIRKLKRGSVGGLVRERLCEFDRSGRGTCDTLFGEMCFCIMTANYAAEPAIRIQKALGRGFSSMPRKSLAAALKRLGHRFPNTRAAYIVEARKHKSGIKRIIGSFSDEYTLRDWLARNVKGLGMKEASHFLRNIGFRNLAILDFHIIDILVENRLVKRPKTLTPKRYREIEAVLLRMGGRLDLDMAELDLYLWYLETGKILK
jgi:N-glycosylase/DNA lyase